MGGKGIKRMGKRKRRGGKGRETKRKERRGGEGRRKSSLTSWLTRGRKQSARVSVFFQL